MYPISEDSEFFAEFLTKYFSKFTKKKKETIKYLDLGTGSGILSETAKKSGIKNILASDIDQEALDFVKSKNLQTIKSNLFQNIKEKFDLITWNTPYLPEDKYDKQKDTTGGKKGDEIIIKFLKQAKSHLNKSGKILILISSITPIKRIMKFKPKTLAKKHIFFEDLIILEIKFN